jgi:hypothetical protein
MKRARTMGYALAPSAEQAPVHPNQAAAATDRAEEIAAPRATPSAAHAKTEFTREDAEDSPQRSSAPTAQSAVIHACTAFGFASLFVAAAGGASYALAHALAFKPNTLHALPAMLRSPSLWVGVCMVCIGWLPQTLFLRKRAIGRATGIGALGAGAGMASWNMGKTLFASREVQILVMGCALYLFAALVLALLGGAKPKPSKASARL